MLTTVDNPYDPYEDFSNWFNYDTLHGYNTSGLVDRIAITSEDFSESLQDADVELALVEWLELVGDDFYKIVYESSTSSSDEA